ncbi:MAG TPA: CYTH domain-containing protein [Planctomycetota bacterium]|nr:CYTH domain-containing protein [Planctomycetota bacterium]
MGKEIERKYLVTGDGWREGASGRVFRQGYLSSRKERTVRVRTDGEKGTLTVKGPSTGAARDEFEYEIPLADAQEMLDRLCERPLIEKTRYVVPFGGRRWEVDVFAGDNLGLVVAEVELESESAPLELPPWAGREVTDDPRYYNANLIRTPYRSW